MYKNRSIDRFHSVIIGLIITVLIMTVSGCGPQNPTFTFSTTPAAPGTVIYRYMLHPNNQGATSVPGLYGVVAAVSGTRHDITFGLDYGLALKSDGTVWSWIINAAGQLQASEPVRESGLSGITAISTGMGNSLALDADGNVWYWYAFGNLSSGITTTAGTAASTTPASRNPTPVQITVPGKVTAISSGLRYSLALLEDGTVWSWGENKWGQLGNDTIVNSDVPVQVNNLNGVIAIAAGHYHSLALKSDGTVWAWGDNESGELGNGTTANSPVPVQVGIDDIVAIAAGEAHSLALKKDGTVWSWGNNESGQAGNGTQNSKDDPAVANPVKVDNLSNVVAIAEGGIPGGGADLNGGMIKYGAGYCLALRSDGTVWTWGAYGSNYEPWTNPFNSTIAQVGNFSDVQVIAGGGNYAIAILPQTADKIIGRWYYNFPQEYDTEMIFSDPPAAASTEIDGNPYLVMSFDPSSSSNNSRLFIFDTEDPAAPRLLSTITYEKQDSREMYLVRSMAVRNNIIYATLFGDRGLWMVDITDPASPKDLGIAPVKMGNNIVVNDDFACASGLDNEVTISDISDIDNVIEAAKIDITSRDCHLAASGKLLFIGIQQTLTIIDISSPASPEKLGDYEIAVPGGLDKDIPNPGPGELQWEEWATINDLQASDDYVYVTFGAGQLRVIDVSNPTDPQEVADIDLNGFCISQTLHNNYLYITTANTDTGKLQLCLVDFSQPEHPVLLYSVPTQSDFVLGGLTFAYCWARPLVAGEYVYFAGRDYLDVVKY